MPVPVAVLQNQVKQTHNAVSLVTPNSCRDSIRSVPFRSVPCLPALVFDSGILSLLFFSHRRESTRIKPKR